VSRTLKATHQGNKFKMFPPQKLKLKRTDETTLSLSQSVFHCNTNSKI